MITTTASADYEAGFEWHKVTDYSNGTVNGSTAGNPNIDLLGNPAWNYESFIGPSGNWDSSTLIPWYNNWRWAAASGFVNVSQWDQNTNLNSNTNNTGINSLVRWVNPTGSTITVDVTGSLRTTWGGDDANPGFIASPVDVRVVLGYHDISEGTSQLLIDNPYTSPISQDTICNTWGECPYIDTQVNLHLLLDAGDSLFWTTIPLGSTPGKNRWITTNDGQLRITLAGSVPEPFGSEHVLLYSTYGYELKGTKRVLVRPYTDPHAFVIDTSRSTWQLVDEQGSEVMSGTLSALGTTYGAELWEIDFSAFRLSGRYKMTVTLASDPDIGNYVLETDYFDVEEGLYTTKSFRNMTIYNAEERLASAYHGYGFYDCNSEIGESYSHGAFLAGLVQGYWLRKDILTPDEEMRLLDMIEVAVDYLLLIHDGETGEFDHQFLTRPGYGTNPGPFNSSFALYGMATYINYFKAMYPSRTADIYNKLLQTINYLDTNGLHWPIEIKVIVHYYLYKYYDDVLHKDSAISYLNTQLAGFNLASKWRGMKPASYFEGLYRMVNSFPEHPDYSYWVQRANEIAQSDYYYIMQNNGFRVVPQGNGPDQWNDMESVPTGWTLEQNPQIWYFNGFFGSVALDALFLAKVTGDHSLEAVTAGSLGWLTGIHIGVASSFVTGTPPAEPISPGAFIININDRYVLPWSSWWWGPPSSNVHSVANGFVIINGEMIHQDRWESGETFIYPDGLFIHATALYEDYLLLTDTCPSDPAKTDRGLCGCGIPDSDTDGDGIEECNDNCPGIYNDQTDTDNDGRGDACDLCVLDLPVKNDNTLNEHASLQASYDDTATLDGHTIRAHNAVITENLYFDRPLSLSITGGYNCNYTLIENITSIKGSLIVSDGTVTIGGIVLE